MNRWQWWCPLHDPGDEPDPRCSHSLVSPCLDRWLCSWCGGRVPPATDASDAPLGEASPQVDGPS